MQHFIPRINSQILLSPKLLLKSLICVFLSRENEYGVIKCYLEGQESDILYRVRDCRPREMVRYRDKVEFVLVTRKNNQAKYARDIAILEKSDTKLLNGYLCALKDSYGFIESEDHATELFFHFSEYEGDTKHLELGDCVMYAETRKGEKCSAEKVCRVLSHVTRDEMLPGIYDGVVTRPLRTVDPEVFKFLSFFLMLYLLLIVTFILIKKLIGFFEQTRRIFLEQ